MPTTDDLGRFLALSARLTGFDQVALEATGLVREYRAVAREQLGEERFARLLGSGDPLGGEPDGEPTAAARALTFLWYTGSWPGPPPFLVSPRAYAEGLVWKAAGLAAPATGPGGYGSWAGPPAGVNRP
ncbi:hypothetical protein ABT354_18085 [Streptomyces sp. NPDC000594]|uniref:hypothetical protein n=1 Tax=Streptomyces sp. NPDC000594 TaxID=3154261 RepID=UPI00332AD81D